MEQKEVVSKERRILKKDMVTAYGYTVIYDIRVHLYILLALLKRLIPEINRFE